MILLRLAARSILNRWLTALLTVLAVAASVILLLGVEKVRTGARDSFANTITDTDLIMGARAGDVQLLLYSVFRIGNAIANVTWESYQDIAPARSSLDRSPLAGRQPQGLSRARHRQWLLRPLSLPPWTGPGVHGRWPVLRSVRHHLRSGGRRAARLPAGRPAGRVARHRRCVLCDHADKPFRVSGILARTGTPVDRTVHISLEALEAIHVDWRGGSRLPGPGVSVDEVRRMELKPKAVTAALIGLKSRLDSFALQRFVNEYPEEALSAVLPGVALQQLWGLVGVAETALGAVAAMVVVTALLGMATMVLATLNERRREMAILRSVGATPGPRARAPAGGGRVAGGRRSAARSGPHLWCPCDPAAADR